MNAAEAWPVCGSLVPVVNKGVLIQGSIVISLAGVDLIYLGLNVVLTSVETALRYMDHGQLNSARNGKDRKD